MIFLILILSNTILTATPLAPALYGAGTSSTPASSTLLNINFITDLEFCGTLTSSPGGHLRNDILKCYRIDESGPTLSVIHTLDLSISTE